MFTNYRPISLLPQFSKIIERIESILLSKLNYYEIRGLAKNWIRSYLSNRPRYQYVVINNSYSENRKIVCGVPQGSILGPPLFLLYINDIVSASKHLKFILFADDTTIYYNGNNEKETIQIINNDLNELNLWFQLEWQFLSLDYRC